VVALACVGIGAERFLNDHYALLHYRYKAYQFQTNKLNRDKSAAIDVSFVAIDDETFWKGSLARRIPLKRDYIANLVEAIGSADPKVVVIDLDLRAPSSDGSPVKYSDYEAETRTLLSSLHTLAETHRIVLSKSVDLNSQGKLVEQVDILDEPSLADVAKNVYRGYVQLPYDLRVIPPCEDFDGKQLDSLSLAIFHAAYPIDYKLKTGSTKNACGARELGFQFGHFLPPERFVDRVVPADAVIARNPDAMNQLYGTVVILFADWHQHSFNTGPQIDIHDSPSGQIPGAFIHANYYEALVHGNHFDLISESGIYVLEFLLILGSAGLTLGKKTFGRKLFATLAPSAVLVLCSYVFLQNLGAFFECFIPVIVLSCHFGVEKILDWREDSGKLAALLAGESAAVPPA
jgi:hypothetical protein